MAGPAVAAPRVDGGTISWPDNGWYEVQRSTDYVTTCSGGRSCSVPAGDYIVVNHSTGERWETIRVEGASTGSPATPAPAPTTGSFFSLDGNRFNWVPGGWYQVQSSLGNVSVCSGTDACRVPDGNYTVINHTTGERFENVRVPASRNPVTVPGSSSGGTDAVASILIEGTTIRWPDNGWYQVQNESDYTTVCEGGTSCSVTPGSYVLVNHTTGERFDGLVVGGSVAPVTPGTGSLPGVPVQVNGTNLSWPDDGWYQVQSEPDYRSVCEGGTSCRVAPGTYTVVNHTTQSRWTGIVVAGDFLFDDGAGSSPPPASTTPPVSPAPPTSVLPADFPPVRTPAVAPFNPAVIPATHGPIASVPYNFDDPFGSDLEASVTGVAGGAPTAPGSLRLDLLSNDWIEINWAPSVDDGRVVAYNIYRNGERLYTVRENQSHPAAGSQQEAAKYWRTTSFIDCNSTRFGGISDPVHQCAQNRPQPGEQYTYQVTAVDDSGNESARSNSVTARLYNPAGGSPIARYTDIYLAGDDTFPFGTDFSRVENWRDRYLQVFADEFNGSSLDRSKWNAQLVWGSGTIINGEQQYFVDPESDAGIGYSPFRFTGDSLVIEAVPTPDSVRASLPGGCEGRCDFLSGAIASHDKFGFTYGYVEGRMRVSGAYGALSSFYLYHRYPGLGKSLHAPEIDIVEYLGYNPFGSEDAFQTYHYADPLTGDTKSSPTMSYANPDGSSFADGWHTYAALWEPGLVIWYIDGREVRRITGPQIGRSRMNIVTYLVAGSEWAPTPAPGTQLAFEIDYIRAYQRPEYYCNNTSTLAAYGGDMSACQSAYGID